jgi:hypothetical protein
MSDFTDQTEAAELLGTIGGILHRRENVLSVSPILKGGGSHEIDSLRVITDKAVLRVEVHPDDD